MVKARLFIEGGGAGKRQSNAFRTAWRDFFQSTGITDNQPAIVRGGSRNQTFDRFLSAARNPTDGEFPILLVDSEASVAHGRPAWEHLLANDGWRRPPNAEGQQAFLMVQAMEAWLLADRQALRNFFGRSFNENGLPRFSNLESIPKDSLEPSLHRATANCNPQYTKGPVSFDILRRVNADNVAARCPHAKALLDFLRSL